MAMHWLDASALTRRFESTSPAGRGEEPRLLLPTKF